MIIRNSVILVDRIEQDVEAGVGAAWRSSTPRYGARVLSCSPRWLRPSL